MTTKKTDPILVQKYPGITPKQAFILLRRLDTWAGGQTHTTSNPHYDVREALASHVLRKLETKR